MPELIALKSTLDNSVNFVEKASNVGYFERRYVRRDNDKVLAYLSSQSGCDMACRMCFLTANGETALDNATLSDFLTQAADVLAHYDQQTPANMLHYNFMARGEPLNNPLILSDSTLLLSSLKKLANERDLACKFLISSIFPNTMGDREFKDIFPEILPEIYYSLYSVNPAFRRRWLGKALPAEVGLDKLKAWADFSGKTPKVHFAFIEGQNDSEEDMVAMAEAINARGLKVNINIVRYNPASARYGAESSEAVIERNVQILRELVQPTKLRIVPKVGFDVNASCGMFINGKSQSSAGQLN